MYNALSEEWIFSVYDGSSVYEVSTPASDGWHMVTGVFDGSSVAIYVDGVLADSAGFGATSLIADGGALNIGGTGSSRYFAGLIDDARIYAAALDGTGVETLYLDM